MCTNSNSRQDGGLIHLNKMKLLIQVFIDKLLHVKLCGKMYKHFGTIISLRVVIVPFIVLPSLNECTFISI